MNANRMMAPQYILPQAPGSNEQSQQQFYGKFLLRRDGGPPISYIAFGLFFQLQYRLWLKSVQEAVILKRLPFRR